MSAITPNTAGKTSPGLKSSTVIASTPSDISSTMMFGSTITSRMRSQSDIVTVVTLAPAVSRTNPFGIVSCPSIWFSSVGRSGAISSMTFLSSACRAVRFEAWRTAASAHAPLRPCSSASPRSDAAASLTTLLPQVFRDVVAVRGDRCRRADVGLRSHREHVRGLADPDAGRGRARAVRRYVDDDGNPRGQLCLDDLPHRLGETAGSVEQNRHGRVAVVGSPFDRVDQVAGGHRIDVARELDGKHARLRLRACRSCESEGSAESREEREKGADGPHVWPDEILARAESVTSPLATSRPSLRRLEDEPAVGRDSASDARRFRTPRPRDRGERPGRQSVRSGSPGLR